MAAPEPVSVRGSERVGWDQNAQDLGGGPRYVAYVDDVRQPLPDASCKTGAVAGFLDCSAKLPSMTSGPHRLQLAVIATTDGQDVESARSQNLNVIVRPDGARVADVAGQPTSKTP